MSFESFVSSVQQLLPAERIITDDFRCFALGGDASCSALKPRAVLRINSEFEMSAVMRLARTHQVSLTFRGAGTSLSGQATGGSVLIQLTSAWNGHKVEPLGERVHLQPAVTCNEVNRLLAPYGRKLAMRVEPPAIATVGGLVANGALEIQGARLILADGSVVDSRDEQSVADFRLSQAELLAQLAELRREIVADAELVQEIQSDSAQQSRAGYRLQAFIAYEDPLEILFQLIAGSEGTLGFISEVAVATVDLPRHQAAVIAGFNLKTDYLNLVGSLQGFDLQRAEMIDASAIPAFKPQHELPVFAQQLNADGCLAFLEFRADTAQALQSDIDRFTAWLADSDCVGFSEFYQGASGISQCHSLASSLVNSVVAQRMAGTTPIYQSYAVPDTDFEPAFMQIKQWLTEFCCAGSLAWGDVTTGRIGFVVCPSFSSEADSESFVQFRQQVVALVQAAGGCLAADYGVGRLNAVAMQGIASNKKNSLLRALKSLLDPDCILNPGVILEDEGQPFQVSFKATPVVNAKIDACTGCGLCESVCVGRGLEFSARQKIAVYREIETRKEQKRELPKYWEDQFKTLALDSCVTTGLCQQVCPMGINTGQLVVSLRAIHNYRYQRLAWGCARHFAALSSWARGSLQLLTSLQRLFGAERVEAFSRRIRRLTGDRTPLLLSTTPGRSRPVYARNELINLGKENTVVYWPSCISQTFGKALADDRENIPAVVQRVLKKADLNVVHPQPTRGLCCGQTLAKKGFEAAGEHMLEELIAALWDISSAGRYPVLADTSACSLRVKQRALERGIHLYDSSEFIDKFLLNRLKLNPEEQQVAVHVTCSTRKLQAEASFYRVLNRLAPRWVEPEGIDCCGYSNEKGFVYPELSEQALKGLPAELKGCVYGVSNSRTCEIGLSRHSGLTYYSLFELLDRHSEALSEAHR